MMILLVIQIKLPNTIPELKKFHTPPLNIRNPPIIFNSFSHCSLRLLQISGRHAISHQRCKVLNAATMTPSIRPKKSISPIYNFCVNSNSKQSKTISVPLPSCLQSPSHELLRQLNSIPHSLALPFPDMMCNVSEKLKVLYVMYDESTYFVHYWKPKYSYLSAEK